MSANGCGWCGPVLALLAGLPSGMLGEPEPDPAELPRLPGLSLQEAESSFRIREGFRVELAAGEPEVVDPVAIAFDADGRLFVAEMRGYPERREEALGRIKCLEDRDGDGRYEHATIFAEGLKWPTGVVCSKDGVFVSASPEILFLRDADGDGRAEERRVVFTGFGAGLARLNMQALVNNLQWGPDGRIYGSTASNGGEVNGGQAGSEVLNVRGSDFSFDPGLLDLRRESGTAQYGLTFDDFGGRYVCSNSRHLIAVMYSHPWNGVPGLRHALVDIPVDGGAAEVFRISRVEPWRVVRTRWRVQGRVGGPVEGGGRAAGYFTSASGLTVYRGDALPAEMRGNVFVGDVGSNLVHRKVLDRPSGRVQPVARRAEGEESREFLASPDTWFRPVQCANGPDGALYIVDMYRETIEHPWSIPESIKKHLDLYSGNDRGRIWRVVTEGGSVKPLASLSQRSPDELVGVLRDGHGWARDTAARLLLEKAPAGIESRLGALVTEGDAPVAARVQALRLLARFSPDSVRGVVDPTGAQPPELRRAFVQLWRSPGPAELAGWVRDPDPGVRYEAALRLLDESLEPRPETLAHLLQSAGGDPWIVQTAAVAAKRHGQLRALVQEQGTLAQAVELLKAGGLESETGVIASLADRAESLWRKEQGPSRERAAAAWILARHEGTSVETLLSWLTAEDEETAKLAAGFLGRRPRADWEQEVLERWQQVRLSAREELLGRMSPEAVLGAVEEGVLRKEEISFQQQRALRNHGEAALRRRAESILGPEVVRSREEAAAHFREALRLEGQAQAGAAIFQSRCAVCHRADASGPGPAVVTLRNKGAPMLLENLIAPDLEVAPQYTLWEVALRDGTVLPGMIASEDVNGVTVRLADGSERRVARAEIAKLTNLNRSLMPAGLEAGLSLQQMADLLSFLTDPPS